MPLLSQGKPLGLLGLQKSMTEEDRSLETMRKWLESHRQLLISVGQELALALANVKLRETLHEQAIRDPLTGLYNRRYVEEMLDIELRRSRRTGHSIGFIMADLDHFKRFNDAYGHGAGDLMLKAVAELIKKSIRAGDIACRYGGEEFLIILPAAGIQDTISRASQIQKDVRQISFTYEERQLGNMTISMGVAVYPEHGNEAAELIRVADQALYRAKNEGRDRVALPPS